MSGWKAKRFWKTVAVTSDADGFAIKLDARPLRTPAKAALIAPTQAMAEAIAAEWQAVDATVDPRRMPVTRAANAAIDKVAAQFNEVAELIAAYGGSDLLCYRAEAPESLTAAQGLAWDPYLDWAAQSLGAPLRITRGIAPVAQPADSLHRLAEQVQACTNFQLTALHDLVSLTGSLVLGLAATTSSFDPETLWRVSRFDEGWQSEQWGEDEDASAMAEIKREDFLRARYFWKLSS